MISENWPYFKVIRNEEQTNDKENNEVLKYKEKFYIVIK